MDERITHIGHLSRLSPAKLQVALRQDIDAKAEGLAELFRGNGWIVAVHEFGRKKALLLSDPKEPDTVLLIVKLLSNPQPVSYEQARQALVDFENNIAPLYGCHQFSLISMSGFEQKAERLESFNMLLQDDGIIYDLLKHYSKDRKREPRIQLFAHNKLAYQKVRRMMEQHRSVAVVQATGTGKSYLIAKLLQDFEGQKRLVMAPSHYVIEQIKEHIRWDRDIEFMTYARSMNLTDAEIKGLQPALIVLDEYHRCGAEEWGRGVQDILDAFPKAFKFGTSATPIRYLDNGRDMSVELFENHVAENLNLAQAIVRNILPMPKYVAALYTLSEEITVLKSRIAASRKSAEIKQQLMLELDSFHIDWEQSRGIPYVLKKHLRKDMRKFIIFCENEQHLNEIEPVVKKWFRDALPEVQIKSYRVFNTEENRDEQFEAFKTDASKEHLHLLFSINMLNEGLHVNEVNGVMLLRPTESPNIFYQQIGRCLKVGMNKQPVIFDFVNNFKSIHTHDFLFDLEEQRRDYLRKRLDESLDDRCPRFNVVDEVREIVEVFGEIKFRVDNWQGSYEQLEEYHKKFGHSQVPSYLDEYKSLWTWLRRQRERHYFGKLHPGQQQKLEALGVEWNYLPVNEIWEKKFKTLKDFFNTHGHTDVPTNNNALRGLREWVNKQRGDYRQGRLDSDRIRRMQELNFEFTPEETRWNKTFLKVKEFIDQHGHSYIFKKQDKPLNKWVNNQRFNQRHGIMQEYQYKKLKSIGFEFDADQYLQDEWMKHYAQLKKYYAQHGNCNVPLWEDQKLGTWVGIQRMRYSKGELLAERQNKLEAVGFEFIRRGDVFFQKRLAELVQFKETHGHFKVPRDSSLGHYIHSMKSSYREGKLSEYRIKKFSDIGFSIEPGDNFHKIRERRLKELEAFKVKYGHVNVSSKGEHQGLGNWLTKIRGFYRSGKLDPQLIDRLNGLGIKWNPGAKGK